MTHKITERVQSEFEQGQETASNRSKSKGCHQNQGNRVPNSAGESYTLLQKWETQPDKQAIQVDGKVRNALVWFVGRFVI